MDYTQVRKLFLKVFLGLLGFLGLTALVAIVVGLETLAVPILRKLRPDTSTRNQKLVLEQVRDHIYRDGTGGLFEVRPIESGHEEEGGAYSS